jgi:hypothetical protein
MGRIPGTGSGALQPARGTKLRKISPGTATGPFKAKIVDDKTYSTTFSRNIETRAPRRPSPRRQTGRKTNAQAASAAC